MKDDVQIAVPQKAESLKIELNFEEFQEPAQYRKTANSLFTNVNRLLGEARKSRDPGQRHSLYIEAMEKSNKAYILLGKAKELKAGSKPITPCK